MSVTSHEGRDLSSVVDFFTVDRDHYILRRTASGRIRIYEDRSSYSAGHGGQCIQWGPVVRRYDPAAGALEGKPAEFADAAQAEAYARRWLAPATR